MSYYVKHTDISPTAHDDPNTIVNFTVIDGFLFNNYKNNYNFIKTDYYWSVLPTENFNMVPQSLPFPFPNPDSLLWCGVPVTDPVFHCPSNRRAPGADETIF